MFSRVLGRDKTLAEGFASVFDAIEGGRPDEASTGLEALAASVASELDAVRTLARAVADANAVAVEMAVRHEDLAEEVRRHNIQLEAHSQSVTAALADLQQQSVALARANVEAVLMADEFDSKLGEAERERDELLEANATYSGRVEELADETLTLARANAQAIDMLASHEDGLLEMKDRAKELQTLNDQLADQAARDFLTDLYNHRHFDQTLRHEYARARRYERDLSVLFVDVDDFKSVNDNFGHPVGDELLRRIGEVLAEATRASDVIAHREAPPLAARYGGDEFVVLLPETSLEDAQLIADRIGEAIAAIAFGVIEGQRLPSVSVSIGVATLEATDQSPHDMVTRADTLLYVSKRCGNSDPAAETRRPWETGDVQVVPS